MSIILQQRGVGVQGLILIDPPPPENALLSSSLIDRILCIDHGREIRSTSDLRRLVKDHFKASSKLLANYQARSASNPTPPIACLRSSHGYCSPDVENIPDWLSNRTDHQRFLNLWQQVSSSTVTLFIIPGHHFDPFEAENVGISLILLIFSSSPNNE
ncbi:hypothetical protein DL96DRAFT_937152 [Flagelloscypha sp. PMI_526]|nr:hypothetical protein DL96DRAFT_937152 [Flagelloscypha sp. PMI_526]